MQGTTKPEKSGNYVYECPRPYGVERCASLVEVGLNNDGTVDVGHDGWEIVDQDVCPTEGHLFYGPFTPEDIIRWIKAEE